MSEVGLTTDQNLSILTVLKKHGVFYSSEIPEVTLYKTLYNKMSKTYLPTPLLGQDMTQGQF